MSRFTLLLALVSTPALAAQPGPASVFAGTYDLYCEQATVDLHIALSGGTATTSGSWNDNATFFLDCDGFSDEDRDDLADELFSYCLPSGVPEAVCADAADDLADAVQAFNQGTAALLPTSVDFTVGSYGWFWSGLVGLYPLYGAHHYEGGATQYLTYLLDNNTGSRGHFAAAGIAVQGGGATDNLACIDTGIGAIDGRIDAATGLLDATSQVDRSLTCLASDGVIWVSGNVGLTFEAWFSGAKR